MKNLKKWLKAIRLDTMLPLTVIFSVILWASIMTLYHKRVKELSDFLSVSVDTIYYASVIVAIMALLLIVGKSKTLWK